MPRNLTTWRKGMPSPNPQGRPKNPEIAALREAIATVETKRKKKLLIHYIEQGFKDNTVLMHIMGRLLPSLKSIDANIMAGVVADVKITELPDKIAKMIEAYNADKA